MKDQRIKPGSIIAQGEDRFCVLLIERGEILMHRIKPTPHGLYTRRVRWADFKVHGYSLVTRFKGRT